MALVQHILNYPDYIAAGGTPPAGYAPNPTTVVIVGRDDVTGAVAWVSYDEASTPVAERLNPSVPAQDWRP